MWQLFCPAGRVRWISSSARTSLCRLPPETFTGPWPLWSKRSSRRRRSSLRSPSEPLWGLGSDRNRRLHRRRNARLPLRRARRPFDLMLDHAALERMPRNAQKLCRLHDAAGFLEGGLAQCSFCFTEIQVFQEDRHIGSLCEKSLVGKPFLVMSHTDTIVAECAERICLSILIPTAVDRKRPCEGEDAPISQRVGGSMRDAEPTRAVQNTIRASLSGNEQW